MKKAILPLTKDPQEVLQFYYSSKLMLMLLFLIDIRRTYPENIYFRDVKNSQLISLRNVLVAYAHHNKSVGYCQVCCYIVADIGLHLN